MTFDFINPARRTAPSDRAVNPTVTPFHIVGFVPDDFDVPLTHVCDGERLEPLSAALASEDHAAISASVKRIRHLFGSHNDWPPATLSDAENRADIARHERAFAARQGFTFSLLGRTTGDYRGCFYIKRIKSRLDVDHRKRVFDAQAFLWLSESCYSVARDAEAARNLQDWLASAWPFRRVAWPGRDIASLDWQCAETDAEAAEGLARQAAGIASPSVHAERSQKCR